MFSGTFFLTLVIYILVCRKYHLVSILVRLYMRKPCIRNQFNSCGSQTSHWVSWKTISLNWRRMHGGLEVRSTREANTTMLGKHIWTILKDTTKPRVQVVNAKYLHGESILRSRQFPGASCTWMSLIEAAESLEPGFKFRVGQGALSICYDRWSSRAIVCNQLGDVDIHIQDVSLCIRDLWCWELLQLRFRFGLRRKFKVCFLMIRFLIRTPSHLFQMDRRNLHPYMRIRL